MMILPELENNSNITRSPFCDLASPSKAGQK